MLFIPAARVRTELIVSRSRFIATAGPADTVEAARAFIAGIRAEMPDANHHVYAYAIGHGATTTLGQSDDGEPSGTSGRPALAVLRGSGLGDTVLVITRYFGGTKLGTGGLVKAYGDAAKAVLAELPRAEKIARQTLTVTLPYPAYEPVRRLLSTFAGTIEEEAFGEGVTLRVELPVARVAEFTRGLGDASAGAARVKQGPA
ncbi:MAG: YigZ family protein [Hymenobacteraceae bacterium]|nr:YigZ family protein [Hymenobacteraceae bacterium]